LPCSPSWFEGDPAESLDPGRVDAWAAWASGEGLLPAGVGQRVRLVARLQRGAVVSGQELASLLGISRAAVHKHIAQLRTDGIAVESRAGAGYLLPPPWDRLEPEIALPLLFSCRPAPDPAGADASGTDFLGLPYRFVREIESTNVGLRGGSRPGTVLVADSQVAGHGRLGRTWLSEPGLDLTFSVFCRPRLVPGRAHLITVAAALAVSDSLQAVIGGGPTIGIKWPNDVQLQGRKVCGILSEASIDLDRVHWAIVGIGLNVNGRPGARVAPAGPGPPPIALGEAVGRILPRAPLLACLLCRLQDRLAEAQADPGALVAAFAARDSLFGRAVVVRAGIRGEEVLASGTGAGIGPDGELLVRASDGSVTPISAGEVTLGGLPEAYVNPKSQEVDNPRTPR